ncbi:MAG: ribulose-phosphate 3-epimerase [Candidatus Omnitrophica bacterium]|nr:ribulose-phosphate 3-epimerase [Candidatus Omnitrophota bacterium]
MKRDIIIAPSILAADFSRLGEEIRAVEAAGADWIHVDVMDGNFVPNITIGPLVVRDIRKITKLPLDVHLMIKEPENYIDEFAKAGSDIITFHIEACRDPKGIISRIKSHGKKAGVSVKPGTGIDTIKGILDSLDLVLVMTVEPGFGGQEFIKDALSKIKELRGLYKKVIEVDGGISGKTSKLVLEAGANALVAGTAIFGKSDYKKTIQELREEG